MLQRGREQQAAGRACYEQAARLAGGAVRKCHRRACVPGVRRALQVIRVLLLPPCTRPLSFSPRARRRCAPPTYAADACHRCIPPLHALFLTAPRSSPLTTTVPSTLSLTGQRLRGTACAVHRVFARSKTSLDHLLPARCTSAGARALRGPGFANGAQPTNPLSDYCYCRTFASAVSSSAHACACWQPHAACAQAAQATKRVQSLLQEQRCRETRQTLAKTQNGRSRAGEAGTRTGT